MNIINFMYFANNFGQEQLNKIFNALGNASHFKSKFENAKGTNGTEKFLHWFMLLSHDNMIIVLTWIEENYKGMSF